MRHTLSIWVENRRGELSRIVGLFSAAGPEIESLTVAEAPDPNVLLLTLVISGNAQAIEQVVRRVDKQVRVLKALDVTGLSRTERELAVISVKADVGPLLRGVLQLVVQNRLKLVGVSEESLTLETTGDRQKVNEIIGLLHPLGVRDIVRSGAVALTGLAHGTEDRDVADAGLHAGPSFSGSQEPAGGAEQ